MERYSYSFSFVPRAQSPGSYMFYMSTNRWLDDACVDSVTTFQAEVTDIAETMDRAKVLAFGIAMADLAYQLVAQEYNRVNKEHTNVNGPRFWRASDVPPRPM